MNYFINGFRNKFNWVIVLFCISHLGLKYPTNHNPINLVYYCFTIYNNKFRLPRSAVVRKMSDTQKKNTELLIRPSGISELDCATTKTDTAERSISIGRESLQVFFLY
jgi:hypothetical protein